MPGQLTCSKERERERGGLRHSFIMHFERPECPSALFCPLVGHSTIPLLAAFQRSVNIYEQWRERERRATSTSTSTLAGPEERGEQELTRERPKTFLLACVPLLSSLAQLSVFSLLSEPPAPAPRPPSIKNSHRLFHGLNLHHDAPFSFNSYPCYVSVRGYIVRNLSYLAVTGLLLV